MHMAEEVEHFWQLICSLDLVRLLDHIRSQIDIPMAVSLSDLLYLREATIVRVKVRAEVVPVEDVLALWRELVVTLSSKLINGSIA